VAFTVVESLDRPGGVIRSARVDGHLLDWGPQRARLVGDLLALIETLGLEDQIVTAPPGLPLYVYHGGKLRLVPFSPGAFLRSDILGPLEKLRLMLEPLSAGADEDETVERYFTRKLGRSTYEHLVGPLYGGLYASDPADMVVGLSLGHVLRQFGVGRSLLLELLQRGGRISPPPAANFQDGMQTLPRALADSLGPAVRLSTPVRGLRRNVAGGGSWTLELDGTDLAAEHVVLTTPAAVTAGLLGSVAPDASARIGSLRYNPLAVVHLLADTELTGLGFQVSLAESLHTRGVTFNDSMFARRGVYTAYLGGARHPEVVDQPDDVIGRLAVEEFGRCTGYEARALSVERERMPAWDRTWSALEELSLPEGVHVAANWRSRPGLPGRLAEARRLADQLTAAQR
jgi:oxygen-dependent protoporphyrinogen oxidase